MPDVTGLLTEFDLETAAARRVQQRVASDRLDWKPHAKWMSPGRQAMRVADLPRRVPQPRWLVVRRFALNHIVHHRGQLTVYLRLLGAPVPGPYGPSADEQ